MLMKNFYKFAVLGATMLLMGCNEEVDTSARYVFADETIKSYLEKHEQYSEYVKLLDMVPVSRQSQSTLGQLLAARGHYTCFAPTNDAMQEFYSRRGVGQLEELPASYVRSFVLYHTLSDSITTEKFITKSSVTNLTGDVLSVEIDSVNAGQATLNGEGQVIEMGISAYNGKVYVLSKAMTPLVETVRPSGS